MFGYASAISDVRVTLGDKHYDCLQKVHAVGRDIVMGFAGSVKVGFAMIERMRELLHVDDENIGWIPEAVAEWWPADARVLFTEADEDERQAGCHLLMIGAHPSEDVGIPGWARTFGCIFRAPDFAPEVIAVNKIASIGCGEQAQPCIEAVEEILREDLPFQGETGNPGGMAQIIGMALTRRLQESQPYGISDHLHCCWVFRRNIRIRANDHVRNGAWTVMDAGPGVLSTEILPSIVERTPVVEGSHVFRMPKIVSTWPDLQSLFNDNGLTAEGAVALCSGTPARGHLRVSS